MHKKKKAHHDPNKERKEFALELIHKLQIEAPENEKDPYKSISKEFRSFFKKFYKINYEFTANELKDEIEKKGLSDDLKTEIMHIANSLEAYAYINSEKKALDYHDLTQKLVHIITKSLEHYNLNQTQSKSFKEELIEHSIVLSPIKKGYDKLAQARKEKKIKENEDKLDKEITYEIQSINQTIEEDKTKEHEEILALLDQMKNKQTAKEITITAPQKEELSQIIENKNIQFQDLENAVTQKIQDIDTFLDTSKLLRSQFEK